MGEYGMISDKSTIKQQLKDANRDYMGRKTWENLYAGIDIAEKQQIGVLKQDYAKAMSDAYATAYKNKAAIGASNIGQGYKVEALDSIDTALQEAYDTYRRNYLQAESEIQAASAEAVENVDNALTEQAGNIKKFADLPYEYLKYLFEKYSEGNPEDNIFLTNELWKRYTYEEKDEEGNLTGERLLKSWEDIVAYGAYDEYTDEFGNKQKEWTGLYDDRGNLTIKGADFYDQMMNDLAQRGGYSFGEWLANYDEDLYDWSQSYNPYDYTKDQRNIGSFRTMVGLTSTDQTYSFIERYGGMSRKELDSMYSKFSDKAIELNRKVSEDNGRGSKGILEEYKGLTNDIADLTDRLGIKDDIEKEMGMSFDELSEQLYNLTEGALSNGEIWWQTVLGAFGAGGTLGSGAAIGAMYGAKVGAIGATTAVKGAALSSAFTGSAAAASSVPVAGWIAAAVIAAAGATYGAVSTAKNLKAQNRQLADAGRTAYNNLVTNLIEYSQSQQRQKQIEWNRAHR